MGPGTEQVVEGNDQNGGHKRVCEGDMARFGVSHWMVESKLMCYIVLYEAESECSETSAYKIQTLGNYPEKKKHATSELDVVGHSLRNGMLYVSSAYRRCTRVHR